MKFWGPGLYMVLTFLFFFLCAPAGAQWRASEIKLVREFNAGFDCFMCTKGYVNNPYVISLRDSLTQFYDDYWRRSKTFPGMVVEEIQLDETHYASADGRPLPFRATYWRSHAQGLAPLVVYLPGVFQDSADPCTYEAVKLLLEAGNHVLVISNPLSAEYWRQQPVAAPAQFKEEAKAVLAVIRGFVARHGGEYSGVGLTGASYGAFLSSIVTALDSQSETPVLSGQTTLIFPPLNMKRAIGNVDQMVVSYGDSWVGVTPYLLIGRAFRSGLTALVQRMHFQFVLDRIHGFLGRRYPKIAQDRLVAYKEGNPITFWKVVTDYVAQDVDFYSRPDVRLAHWIELARKAGNERVRVLTTADDWLNEGVDPRLDLPAWFQSEEHLLVRHTGGHAGMVVDPWFARFVVTSMGRNSN